MRTSSSISSMRSSHSLKSWIASLDAGFLVLATDIKKLLNHESHRDTFVFLILKDGLISFWDRRRANDRDG